MQIGGLTLARARTADGRVHSPSPQINPEATAGIINSAFLGFSLLQAYTTKLPMHISMAKYAPTRNGIAITIGNGIHLLTTFPGAASLTILTPTAKAKNP
ncbi:unnamed protein product [Linum tenue]|uniref:Uncharacterized protein n=1 Tax=Linum tenue TaxID=586396 RepID=A0AAV0M7G8_9ROSI|nr:unnamed protein product [Linum tenue]